MATRSASSSCTMLSTSIPRTAPASSCSPPRAAHPLDAVDEGALQVVGLRRDLQRRKPLADLVEDHGDLSPSEVGTEAEVRAAGAEPDLLGLQRPRDVEAIGIGEDGGVAVRRVVPQHELLAGGDLGVADHRVLGGGAPEVDHWCRAAHDLFDGGLGADIEIVE